MIGIVALGLGALGLMGGRKRSGSKTMQGAAGVKFLNVSRETLGQGAASGVTGPYATLIATSDADAKNAAKLRDMMKMSGCALVVRGWLQRAGAYSRILQEPYRIGQAVADVVQLAREASAWTPATRSTVLRPGDIYLIGVPEHVGVLESVTPNAVGTIDGGQRDAKGLQTIARTTRQIVRSGRGVLLNGRPLIGTIDTTKLLAHHRRPSSESPVS